MKLSLQLSPSKETIPFDNQYLLMKRLHHWLGSNDLHDELSLYSFSWLQGGRANRQGLHFPSGSSWQIGFWDKKAAKRLISTIRQTPEVIGGMEVQEIQLLADLECESSCVFKVASPVLAKSFDGSGIKHWIYEDKEADQVMTTTLKSKLRKAGLAEDGVSVSFDRTYQRAKTQLVDIKRIKNRASMCPVKVTGSPEQIDFAWQVGVGHLTGCGFGALW